MSLIDNTYFNTNDINIPANQLERDGIDLIQPIIDVYEPVILECGLGYELYKALLADLDIDGLPQSARFTSLINGSEFTFTLGNRNIVTKWSGFVNAEKKSLIAYYVYFEHRNQTEDFFSGAGQITSAVENGTKVDVRPKLRSVWNKMVDMYSGSWPCSWDTNLDYYDNSIYAHFNALPSLYNYLLTNIELYPEWIFKPKEKLNIFGI